MGRRRNRSKQHSMNGTQQPEQQHGGTNRTRPQQTRCGKKVKNRPPRQMGRTKMFIEPTDWMPPFFTNLFLQFFPSLSTSQKVLNRVVDYAILHFTGLEADLETQPVSETLGTMAEDFVEKHVRCPNCGNSMKSMGCSTPLMDIECDCECLYEVKSCSTEHYRTDFTIHPSSLMLLLLASLMRSNGIDHRLVLQTTGFFFVNVDKTGTSQMKYWFVDIYNILDYMSGLYTLKGQAFVDDIISRFTAKDYMNIKARFVLAHDSSFFLEF